MGTLVPQPNNGDWRVIAEPEHRRGRRGGRHIPSPEPGPSCSHARSALARSFRSDRCGVYGGAGRLGCGWKARARAEREPRGTPPVSQRQPVDTPIDDAPVDPNSDALIASIGLSKGLHPDFGADYNGGPFGIPYVVVSGGTPGVTVSFDYADESDPGPYPIPRDAPIEGGSSSGAARPPMGMRVRLKAGFGARKQLRGRADGRGRHALRGGTVMPTPAIGPRRTAVATSPTRVCAAPAR